MKCATHIDVDAVATCGSCNRGLCKACTDRFDRPFCEACVVAVNKSIANQLYLGLAITISVLIASFYMSRILLQATFLDSILSSVAFAGLYWGWRFLSDHAPRLEMASILVWVFYLYVKLMLACLIGFFVAPYQIFKMVRELKTIRELERQLSERAPSGTDAR